MKKQHILLVNATHGFGGATIHVINLYRMLKANNYHVSILVPARSTLSKYLQKNNLAHYTTYAPVFSFLRPLYHFILRRNMRKLCRTQNISIIHCNNRTEVTDALAIKKSLPISVAFTRHDSLPFAIKKMKSIDAIIAVSNTIKSYIISENQKLNLGIKYIEFIPPLFDSQSFLNYETIESRDTFYKKNLGITLKQYPIITMIANFYQNKNHQLLLKAIHILIHKKNNPVQVMLAGNGPQQVYLESLSKQLKLDQYVNFLGFYNNIPALLYHTDIMVLSSIKEAFPIVYLETGLMKKPAIGVYDSGTKHSVIHEQTGLLFKNNDVDDLVIHLERLIYYPIFRETLGNNAYVHVMQNFSPESSFEKYQILYQKLLKLNINL